MKDASYRFGFNGKEKDSDGEWGNSAHYDYGFRIYDPSIARFLSVDPLARDFAWNSPYSYAENDVIRSIDLEGLEKVVVHLIGGDKKPKLNQATREEVQNHFKSRMTMLNVNLTIEFIESNKIYTRDGFYNREGAHWSDSYILLGSNSTVQNTRTEDFGWEDTSWHSNDHVGVSARNQGIAKIGFENFGADFSNYHIRAEIYNTANEKEAFQSYSFGEALSIYIEHESLHPKLRFNPANLGGSHSTGDGVPGHFSGLMGEAPLESVNMKTQRNYYDSYTQYYFKGNARIKKRIWYNIVK